MSETVLTSERLLQRIRAEAPFDVPEGSRIRRLYPGHWQRSAGAWVWCIERPGMGDVGSQWTMGDCVKAEKLTFSEDEQQWHVEPVLPIPRKRKWGYR